MEIQPKIKAVGAAGAAAVIIIWLAGWFAPDLMATAPIGLESLTTALIMAGAGWLKAG
jgi:hypothetical protein